MSASAPFPSLTVRANGTTAQGSFAQAQSGWLNPSTEQVAALRASLDETLAGIVAHYYMDVELQSVLYACQHPRVHVSDSLLMADKAVQMVESGARAIVVLGVDFMAENARAMLDAAGHEDVPVLRVDTRAIGCSLAAAAESLAYGAWLTKARDRAREEGSRALHVVYINTSLRTKAQAHTLVPTITCTSSNVVATVLQAFAQEPQLRVYFGPDTYMGENLARLFRRLAESDRETVQALHPQHTPETIAALVERFDYFRQGNCVVHHMFDARVSAKVEHDYPDAHVTAHLEVPGPMFELGLSRQIAGKGVVGSTSDILRYIKRVVVETFSPAHATSTSAPARNIPSRPHGKGRERPVFVLGTEASMIAAIVREMQVQLRAVPTAPDTDVAFDVVFPVASEAIHVDESATDPNLGVLPGPAGGEGCSPAGGCATCPYMKMNSLDALMDVLGKLAQDQSAQRSGTSESALRAYWPRSYREQTAGGQSLASVGRAPILHMRHFQKTGQIPSELLVAR